jgi:hypothetical protein
MAEFEQSKSADSRQTQPLESEGESAVKGAALGLFAAAYGLEGNKGTGGQPGNDSGGQPGRDSGGQPGRDSGGQPFGATNLLELLKE